MIITASASRRRVRPSRTFLYRVGLRSPTKKGTLNLQGLALQVVLPNGTQYSKGKTFPKRGWKTQGQGPVVPVLINNTVTWPLSTLGGVNKRKFIMQIKTSFGVPTPSSLTLGAFVYQLSGAGLQVCPLHANNVTVAVV